MGTVDLSSRVTEALPLTVTSVNPKIEASLTVLVDAARVSSGRLPDRQLAQVLPVSNAPLITW